jgi:hypothetical protein
MIRRLARLALALWAAGSMALAGYVLAQHPFATPLVAQGEAAARAALTRAIAATATPEWIVARLAVAVAEAVPLDVALYLDLARDQGAVLPADLRAEAEAMVAADQGKLARVVDCGVCMLDIGSCQTLTQIGACAIPFELTPLGDVNALRRAGVNWAHGQEVDQLEAGLAVVGLGASGLVLLSGGASAPVKAGATVLRLARKLGALPPGLARAMREAAEAALRGGDEGVQLVAMAGDIGRVAGATSPAEALLLLRHADDAQDLARLARLAEVAGPDTRRAVAVLGKARAFRALTRISDLALAAMGLVGLVLAQVGAVLAALIKLALRRTLHPRRAVAKRAGFAP